jgi:hypothetical protein
MGGIAMKRHTVLPFIVLFGTIIMLGLVALVLLIPSALVFAQEITPTPTNPMFATPTPSLFGTPTLLPTIDPFALTPTEMLPTEVLVTSTPFAVPAANPSSSEPAANVPFGRFSSGDNFLVRVDIESLIVRRLPTQESEHVASLFDGEIVQAVSRNLDGSWFELRRLGRMNSLGWVLNDYLEWDFLPERLALGDISVDIIGPVPLREAPQYGVYLEEAPILREIPLRDGRRIMSLPYQIVVPVLARNQDAAWLQVNYFGFQGWIHRASIRERGDVDWNTLPVPPGTPLPDTIPVIIIPIELQQAQIDRLRAFVNDRRGLAAGLEAFWWGVYRGEIMPCNAPPEVIVYPYTEQDVRELPELGRYVPRLAEAVDFMEAAREPLLTCGIVSPTLTIDARNNAINAKLIFDATLQALENLEETIYANR